ncbi:hypothetical protein ANN_09525 [Periplaneta americana]|uniref:Uncharacterized protein n=1 Tax=Periplaneta americana TaxID=6978 RepID=A0ABQ8TMJ8_PERAM|nr:hypothetical protein ANN_09525 [Periplaneta americana]
MKNALDKTKKVRKGQTEVMHREGDNRLAGQVAPSIYPMQEVASSSQRPLAPIAQPDRAEKNRDDRRGGLSDSQCLVTLPVELTNQTQKWKNKSQKKSTSRYKL